MATPMPHRAGDPPFGWLLATAQGPATEAELKAAAEATESPSRAPDRPRTENGARTGNGTGSRAEDRAEDRTENRSETRDDARSGTAPRHSAARGAGAGTGTGARRTERSEDADTTRVVALVDLAKRGDAEAFGQLYDHYVSMIYRYIYYRVGGHALAEDLTSETFLRALRSLSMFRWQGRDFGAWLVTIARNLVADHYKSGRYRMEMTSGEILDHDTVTDGPEDDVLAALSNQTLMAAVTELGSDQQECLVLRFLNGLTVAETARALGKSEGAVKQLQLRAIRNLAKRLPDGFR